MIRARECSSFLWFVLGVLTHRLRSSVHQAVNWLGKRLTLCEGFPLVSCLRETAVLKMQVRDEDVLCKHVSPTETVLYLVDCVHILPIPLGKKSNAPVVGLHCYISTCQAH